MPGVEATLLSYLPIDRRHSLADRQPLPDRADGAALFADVSGVTPLAEALGPLITSIEQYRGSVVGFSGDAITCWFEQDTGRRATFLDNVPAHRALVAAWRQHLDGEQEAA